MGGKTEDIENWIHTSKLGAGYSQILCHGWVRYLLQKNAAGGAGQSTWQVQRLETGKRDI